MKYAADPNADETTSGSSFYRWYTKERVYYQATKDIRARYKNGELTYEEARALIEQLPNDLKASSTGHYENLINTGFNLTGFAVAENAKNSNAMLVQDFVSQWKNERNPQAGWTVEEALQQLDEYEAPLDTTELENLLIVPSEELAAMQEEYDTLMASDVEERIAENDALIVSLTEEYDNAESKINYYTTLTEEKHAIAEEKRAEYASASAEREMYTEQKAAFEEQYKSLLDELIQVQSDDIANNAISGTAYAALTNQAANSRGYALLLYRMLLAAGVDTRVIDGTVGGNPHKWNIVRIGMRCYNVDAATAALLKAANSEEKNAYLLKTDANAGYLIRNAEYAQESFQTDYPMGTKDYYENDIEDETVTPNPAPTVHPMVVNVANGVKIFWDKVNDVQSYVVYRKDDDSDFVRIAVLGSDQTSYVDETAQMGIAYKYAVCSVTNQRIESTKEEVSILFVTPSPTPIVLAKPTVSASLVSNGVKVSWNKVDGAAKYRVFYRVKGDSKWIQVTDTADANYTVTGLTSGTTYSFTVRCLDTSGKFNSEIAQSKHLKYVAAPVLKAPSLTTNGVKVSWESVGGAGKYRVLYKLSGASKWTTAGDTTGTNYTVTGLASGKTYVFTVCCLNAAGTSYTSAFDTTGKTKRYVQAPVLSGVSNASNGITVKWKASSGASQYRVLYKESGSSTWKTAGDTSSTSFTVKGLSSGKTYVFTARSLNVAGTSYTSAYDTKGKSLLCLATPKVTAAQASKGVKVSWNKVSGAAGYYVYRKVSGESWTKIKDIKSGSTVSYTDTTGTSKIKYIYTVRAYKGSVMGYYNTTGASAVAK